MCIYSLQFDVFRYDARLERARAETRAGRHTEYDSDSDNSVHSLQGGENYPLPVASAFLTSFHHYSWQTKRLFSLKYDSHTFCHDMYS